MSLVDEIMGRKTILEDCPPMQAARPQVPSAYRKKTPEDEEKERLKKAARRSSVVASILGVSESDDERIIPQDAKRLDAFSGVHDIPGMEDTPNLNSSSPSEPSTSTTNGEQLIPPTAALVAPDITPDVFKMIDPSSVPAPPERPVPPGGVSPAPTGQPQHALDTLMGRQNTAPPAGPEMPPVTAESFEQMLNPGVIKAKVAESLIPSVGGGNEMPIHKEGDGRAIYNTFRRFVG